HRQRHDGRHDDTGQPEDQQDWIVLLEHGPLIPRVQGAAKTMRELRYHLRFRRNRRPGAPQARVTYGGAIEVSTGSGADSKTRHTDSQDFDLLKESSPLHS